MNPSDPCPRLPGCNPLIGRDPPSNGWQAWCRRCNWEAPVRAEVWQARNDKRQRKDGDDPPPPEWARGPRR